MRRTKNSLGWQRCAFTAAVALCGAVSAPAVVVTRGPYLQQNDTDSIIVRWRTDLAVDSRVNYGTAVGSLTSMTDEPTVTTEHIVALSSLTADTQYFYSIGVASGTSAGVLEGDDAAHYFRTSPPVGSTDPMRIWLTGDGGFANASAIAVRDAYATFNAGGTTDLFVLLGDNAYLLGTDAEHQAALFDMHHDTLLTTPVWSTFGNHEAFSSNSLTETGPYFDLFSFPRAGEVGGEVSGTEAYYSFDYANVHLISLDSHFSSNAPASAMYMWLESDLQNTTADWVIAFWHHPPYSKGLFHDSDVEQREIDMRANIVPLLDAYGVDLVLNGHSHSYERTFQLDGHYGLSTTLTPAMVLDSGDGDPSGDGAYRKETVGTAAAEGSVFVVAGASSESRPLPGGHPAMATEYEGLGSLVVDVDDLTLTATFINENAVVIDSFVIKKGAADCPAAPRVGCEAGAKGRLILKDKVDNSKDKMIWKWKDGNFPTGDLGTPTDETDLAICLYGPSGALLGGSVRPGGANLPDVTWKTSGSGVISYTDKAASESGFFKLKLKPGVGTNALLLGKGKGINLALPSPPLTLPLTAQMANLDNDKCWQSVFTTATKNEAGKLVAKLP